MFTYLVDSPGNCTTDTDKCHCHNIIVWVCNTVVVGWEGAGGGLAARYKINILNKKFLGSTNFKLLNHTSGNSINEYDILICNCCFRDGHGAYSHRAPRNPATPLHTDTHTYTHTHTHTHTQTALRRPFTIPGSWSNTISVFFLIPVPRPVNSLPPPNKIPSLAFLKKSVPQSICDRLFMNISYTRGLKGSTLARLRALWERKANRNELGHKNAVSVKEREEAK